MSLPCAFAQGAGYWHTAGSQILDSNNQTVRIAGVNWYGFETTDEIAHGLWAQDYHTILSEIKSNGYNVIRIPFSNQMVETPINPTNFTQNVNGQAANTDLAGLNALQILDKIITAAGADGLRVILDNHRSEAGNSNEANGLWYTSSYPESAWINDWKTLATRYRSFTDASGNPIVIGMDLRNEPHLLANGSTGACWTGDTSTSGCPTSNTAQNWPAAATRAANAILAINPSLLIFIEGNDCYSGDCGWQGGNLEGVASNPVSLSVANRVVYSAHDYGPNLYAQSWFNGSTTLASLEAVWNRFWGYISSGNTAPVWVGEFGTDNNNTDIENTAAGSQGQWFQSLVTFLQNNPNLSWTYWALNGEDSYALLNSQYSGVQNSLKQNLLATIQFPLGGGGTPDFSLSASPTSLTVNQGANGTSTITVSRLNGFAGAVSFTASGLPSGVTASFNPATTTTSGTSSVLTLAASSTAAAGTATVTVTGTSGSLTHTASITLTVTSVTPDFSLSASPTSLTVNQGGSGTSTITITRLNGFAGAVSFTASGLPSGVTASFNPATTTTSGTGSVLTLAASSTATAGTVTVTVTGTSGSLSHTAAIALTVATTSGTGGVTVTPVLNANSPWFNEEDVKLSNTGALTALSVTIIVQRTTGVSFSGLYNTVGGQITQAYSSTSSAVTYTFTLNSGQTLSPGSYTFAAQTSGNGTTHPVAGDTYTVTYTTANQTFTQTGNF
jgi:endoglucanase